ncbi:hypothetical protein BDR22DRAFT_964071 [Usnea florida]
MVPKNKKPAKRPLSLEMHLSPADHKGGVYADHVTLLGVILGISRPSFSITVNLLNRIELIAPVVSREQKSGPRPPSLPPASRLSLPTGNPNTIGRRDGIHIQELGSDLHVYYHVFRTFAPSWSAASTLAVFWYKLATELSDFPDHFFTGDVIRFSYGMVRLELYNLNGGTTSGVPRQFVHALANAMLAYTYRGFCGMFNARVSGTSTSIEGLSEGVTLWITFRVVDRLGAVIGV